jgi:hypothetical protein
VEQRTLRPDELVPYLELPSDEAVEAACELLGKLLTAIAPATIHAEYQVALLAHRAAASHQFQHSRHCCWRG